MRPDYASGAPASAILNASDLVMDYGAANVRAAADHGTAGTGPASVHTLALNHVDFTLREGESVAVMGPSGSGKSTLLHALAGIIRPTAGTVTFRGANLTAMPDAARTKLRRSAFGFVFQSGQLLPELPAVENIALPMMLGGVDYRRATDAAILWLERLGLRALAGQRPGEMSGGQMQRVAIARALVNDPDIVLADEPTGALDSDTSVQIMDLLKEVARDRLVVMVTHNPDLAEQYATRIVNLRDGRIVDDSDPYVIDEAESEPAVHRTMGKASMSFGTAVALSFNNLRTKMARTALTSFAGSIGIIGIALILSVSTGVNNYIIEVFTGSLGTDQIVLRIGSTRRDEAFEKEIKDTFRSKVRVAPEVVFEPVEYIAKKQMPQMSRKQIKFVDLREQTK